MRERVGASAKIEGKKTSALLSLSLVFGPLSRSGNSLAKMLCRIDWEAISANDMQGLLTKKAPIAESLDSVGGASRNRTDVQGFAVLCIATLPPGQEQ